MKKITTTEYIVRAIGAADLIAVYRLAGRDGVEDILEVYGIDITDDTELVDEVCRYLSDPYIKDAVVEYGSIPIPDADGDEDLDEDDEY